MKLEDRMRVSIRRRSGHVVLRTDLAKLGSTSQVSQVLSWCSTRPIAASRASWRLMTPNRFGEKDPKIVQELEHQLFRAGLDEALAHLAKRRHSDDDVSRKYWEFERRRGY